MMHIRIFPWFWEIQRSLSSTTYPNGFDHKGLFLWLFTSTQPKFGFYGPLMGIANRRRIWRACQGLVPLYKEIMYPQPTHATSISAQFILSWAEITHLSRGLLE